MRACEELPNNAPELWLVVPTYNEVGNVVVLIEQIFRVLPSAHLIIVDDNSPDGTAEVVAKFVQNDKLLHLLRRPAKLGYTSAVMTGLGVAWSRGAQILGYMDADLSHDPQVLLSLLAAVQEGADLAIGSRYVAGGGVIGWSWRRKALSKCANWLVRRLLRLPIRDSTSGFRLFRREALERLRLERIRVDGYAFQFVSAAMAIWEGLKVTEVPIVFRERQLGQSKLSIRIVVEASIVLFKMAWWRRTGRWLGKPVLADA